MEKVPSNIIRFVGSVGFLVRTSCIKRVVQNVVVFRTKYGQDMRRDQENNSFVGRRRESFQEGETELRSVGKFDIETAASRGDQTSLIVFVVTVMNIVSES